MTRHYIAFHYSNSSFYLHGPGEEIIVGPAMIAQSWCVVVGCMALPSEKKKLLVICKRKMALLPVASNNIRLYYSLMVHRLNHSDIILLVLYYSTTSLALCVWITREETTNKLKLSIIYQSAFSSIPIQVDYIH